MKKILITPYNNIAKEIISKKDFSKKYKLLGFVDNSKYGDNIFKIAQINFQYDEIIICSPNHFNSIYKNFLQCKECKINKKIIKFYINDFDIYTKNIAIANILYGVLKLKQLNIFNKYKYKTEIFFLRNKNKNSRIFLVGNGPSLQVQDLDKLKNEITFAANKIYLAYEKTTWRPTYYMVEDDLVFIQNYELIKNLKDSIKLFPYRAKVWAPQIDDATYFNLSFPEQMKEFPQFSNNPLKELYWGSTVIFTMIQWAAYLGCKKIYLIGIDFNFNVPNEYVGKQEIISDGEVNHFHKNYRKKNEKWNKPNLDIQVLSFQKAKEFCDSNDIKIYNASRDSKLDVFEKVDFDLLFL